MRWGLRNQSEAALENARRLRREASVSEIHLWAHLRGSRLGFKFRRQVPVGPYVLDFYCAEAALCVEADGEQHAARRDLDAKRDGFLAGQGILTFRFPTLALFDGREEERVLREIIALCESRVAAGR